MIFTLNESIETIREYIGTCDEERTVLPLDKWEFESIKKLLEYAENDERRLSEMYKKGYNRAIKDAMERLYGNEL